MRNKIIQFDPKERILEKVEEYLECKDRLLEERNAAIPLLLKALKYADHGLKQKIVILLGAFADSDVVWPLYELLADPTENEEIRYLASMQLKMLFPTLEDKQPLIDRLFKDIESDDSEMRVYAAGALGWRGNFQAAIPLVSLLYDSDMDVMQAAVNSLTELGDDRVFNVLLDRLRNGPVEQKRCILFSLWHLDSMHDEVIEIYREFLQNEHVELRYDALMLLRSVTEPGECLDAYLKCLKDEDPRIRVLALERIGESAKNNLQNCKKKILSMISDPDTEVQATAKKIMNML